MLRSKREEFWHANGTPEEKDAVVVRAGMRRRAIRGGNLLMRYQALGFASGTLAMFLIVVPAFALAQSVEVREITSTAAVAYIRGAYGACTGTVTNLETNTAHPYMNNVDLSVLENYVTWADGTRVVTLGRQRDSDALRAETDYSLAVAGCMKQTVTFRTPAPYFGVQPGRNAPFNSAKYGNLAWPSIDWGIAGKNNTYTDPLTGVAIKLLPSNGDIGWKSVGGGNRFATYYSGGANWTNAERVGNGSTTSYGTVSASTESLDLFVPLNQSPWSAGGRTLYPNTALDNLGLLLWCSGDDAAAENRQVKVGVWDGAKYVMYQILTCRQGSVAKLDSASTDADKPWPLEFLDGGFAGWSGGGKITRDMFPSDGTMTVRDGSTLFVQGYAAASKHIPHATKPGAKVLLTGSGCRQELCTFASITNADNATVAETIKDGSYPFAVYPWSIRVEKTTATGTLNAGLKWKVHGDRNLSTSTMSAIRGHPVPVVSGDGKSGTVAAVGGNHLYFISDDFTTFRSLSIFYQHPSKFRGMPAEDRVASYNTPLGTVYPSSTEAGVWYSLETLPGRRKSVFKITYTSNYTEDYIPGKVYGANNSLGGTNPLPSADGMTWENIMPASQGKDFTTQVMAYIAANGLTANEWYGFNGNMNFSGISGSKAFFYTIPGSQDAGPCLMAVVELTTGTVEKMFSTATGPGDAKSFPAQARWGACHNTSPSVEFDNSVAISTNSLNAPGNLFGGPFEVTPAAVKMPDGGWSTNTALAWPLDDAANTYDRSCPSNIPKWLKDFGATGNQCVTVKLPSHPCNVSPGATARAQQPPCPWNASYTMPQSLQVGDRFYDEGTGPGKDTDTEHFRVVNITNLPGGELEVVLQRNSVWDYCCRHDASSVRAGQYPNGYCLQAPWQATHARGFTLRVHTGQTNSCGSSSTLFTFGTNGALTYSGEASRSSAGHTAIGKWLAGQKILVGFSSSKTISSPAQLHTKYPGELNEPVIPQSFPKFSGIASTIGSNSVQAYYNRSHSAASNLDLQWTLDANAINNPNGGASIGSRTITPVAGMPDVYEMQVKGIFASYKKHALHGWAGWYILRDVTGSGSIKDAPEYSLCFNYTAGLCGTGTQGKVYVRVPRAWYADGQCHTGNTWAMVPCVHAAEPVTGWIRRMVSHAPNANGQMTQNLTMGFTAPGLPGAFWGAAPTATGKAAGIYSSSFINGLGSRVVLFRMPNYSGPRDVRTDFGGLTVKVGQRSDVTYARVRFGYNASFHCTEASLQCVTDTAVAPYAFDGQDPLTAISCSRSCTIPVPAIPGRLLYYRVETFDGRVWSTGDTMVAVP
jgi:hypothetical protein